MPTAYEMASTTQQGSQSGFTLISGQVVTAGRTYLDIYVT